MKNRDFTGSKIGVFGLGVSGLAAYQALHQSGASLVVVSAGDPTLWGNEIDPTHQVHSDQDPKAQTALSECEFIVKAPGISPKHPVLSEARQKNIPLWSEIELGYQFADAPIIAITGTNGKTTTVSLLGHLLKRLGLNVFVGGNIGRPFCDYFLAKEKADLIVLEISSFQLEDIHEFRPTIGAILNLSPNHGERYDDPRDYYEAKFNLTKNMREEDHLIYGEDQGLLSSWANNQKTQTYSFQLEDLEEYPLELKDDYKLVGSHNLLNLLASLKIIQIIHPGFLKARRLRKGLREFNGVAHRLENLSNSEFEIFNDAKSTNWEATLTALNSLKEDEREIALILGGKLRGNNDSSLPYLKTIKEKVKKVYLMGETTDFLYDELNSNIPCEKSYTLEDAFQQYLKERNGETLLFSPGFPSFDQFKNYVDRGNQFKSLLETVER